MFKVIKNFLSFISIFLIILGQEFSHVVSLALEATPEATLSEPTSSPTPSPSPTPVSSTQPSGIPSLDEICNLQQSHNLQL